MNLIKILEQAKKASKQTAKLSTDEKNKILLEIADMLENSSAEIVKENKKDCDKAKKNKMGSLVDRLLLNKERIENMANEVRNIASLHDYIGEKQEPQKTPSGISPQRITVPLGVIAMIYESRPNVTIDAASLAFKSGNAIVLKGGKEAKYSNKILSDIFSSVLEKYNLGNAVQLLENATREDTAELMKAKGKIDLLIPRGGRGLIQFVTENAQVPVIETGASVVHTFIDEFADIKKAAKIIVNQKQRNSVCNALDTLLLHENLQNRHIETLLTALTKNNTKIHVDENKADYSKEWLSNDINVKWVHDIDEAIAHIDEFSLGHSECIITENEENAQKFLQEIDSACVYHNVSTWFSDGAQFGLGAEMGISTQKLHARGPFALEALTTYKWIVSGNGETR